MGISWVKIMNEAVAILCGAIIGVVGSILINWLGNRKGYKNIDAKLGKLDNETLVGHIDKKCGKLDDVSLSGQHKHIEDFIRQNVGDISNTTLSGQHNSILNAVRNLGDQIKSAKDSDSLKRQQLTGDQARIEQSVSALSAFSRVMADLQSENLKLRQEIQTLKDENQLLTRQLKEQESQSSEEQSEETSMKMA